MTEQQGPSKIPAVIRYRLNQTGQRAAVLAGVNAARIQTVSGSIAPSDLDLFHVDEHGNVVLDIYDKNGAIERVGRGGLLDVPFHMCTEWDSLQTFDELLGQVKEAIGNHEEPFIPRPYGEEEE